MILEAIRSNLHDFLKASSPDLEGLFFDLGYIWGWFRVGARFIEG